MLDKVKIALRMKGTSLDSDVQETIDACKADLQLAGVQAGGLETGDTEPSDPLIRRAIILYAKATYDFEGQGDRYQRAYDALKMSMMLAGDYQ